MRPTPGRPSRSPAACTGCSSPSSERTTSKHFLAFFFNPTDAFRFPAAIVSLLAADVLGPGRWKKTIRFRALQGLAQVQQIAVRFGRPIVEPLAAGPNGGA